jgi:hypothetical protein
MAAPALVDVIDRHVRRERKITAIHECAHAAAVELVGYEVTKLVLTDNGGGRCYFEIPTDDGFRLTEYGRWEHVVIALAGPLASRRTRSEPGQSQYGLAQIIDLVMDIRADPEPDGWRDAGGSCNDLWSAASAVTSLEESEARALVEDAALTVVALFDVAWHEIQERAARLCRQPDEPVGRHPITNTGVIG